MDEVAVNLKTWASYVAAVVVQVAYGGANIIVKIALAKGMNQQVLLVYRHVLAVLLLAPFAYVLERKQRPPLSFWVMVKIFVLASIGITIHLNVFYAGLGYTSPTVAHALSNASPALTFLVAVLIRMEKVETGSARGRAKLGGAFTCIAGSLIFTFWKGGYLFKSILERPLIHVHEYDTKAGGTVVPKHRNWMKGSALILTSNITWCTWLIFQGIVYKIYPAPLSLNALVCLFALLQSSFLAIFFCRDPALWRLEWDVQLLAIIYSGLVTSLLANNLQIWCISINGPVFAAMFSPLSLVFVAIFSAIAFAERLHLGSVMGAFVIIVGLYCMLWGKRADNLATEPFKNGKGFDGDDTMQIPETTNSPLPITSERK
ncbi:WAT1-related protein At1g43650-like [Diospyros lotus]|uniref:WAT1-related protein At1g43650-like n=1 Tax=Diospyros lotus TaxID=55363 RepID=UPI00225042E4|nr:WAT1-related protein At1g43650-like [Diospyros lotus]